jgi:hypothetical protein
MELIQSRSGASLWVYTPTNKDRSMPRCSYSSQKKDNSNFWRAMQGALLTYQSQTMPPIKITYSVSVRKRLLRLIKKFTLWRLETLLLDNKSSRKVLILQCQLMCREIFLSFCKLLTDMELFLRLPN